MITTPSAAKAPNNAADAPITNFTECHAGILSHLRLLDELPGLLGAAVRARQLAKESLAFFQTAIFEHHAEEERELFPAVLASAQSDAERHVVQTMTHRLELEHRVLEGLWKSLEEALKRVARGQDADLNGQDLYRLVESYAAHASFEESEFLPLAELILGRNSNHMAALGLSLHMRHVPVRPAYI
ncbi:MAG: hemerythrin domain-containing protein [Hydrogenophaga sp.]|jgi:hemerythrin-like domain-containing protein|nr:hemerythrin domain-containing protein [Hydrogenophaga sp.]